MKYEYIEDLTSDIVFRSYGKDLKELFENSAVALFSIISDIEKVQPKNTITIEITAENKKDLLFNWLQTLIATVDTDEMFFSEFIIQSITNTKLTAECKGEPIQPQKGNTLVKAVTNYKFNIEEKENKLIATVSLDI